MAALAPPQNTAGVPRPAVPTNPASLVDITNAKEYIERLSSSKTAAQPTSATSLDIGAAEAYKAAVIFSYSPIAAAPTWLANLNTTVQQMAADIADMRADMVEMRVDVAQLRADAACLPNIRADMAQLRADAAHLQADVTHLRQQSDALPILLANSQAGPRGPLFNPTALQNGWAQQLVPPNPRNRDELLTFTVQQCNASANNLGLPALGAKVNVLEKRRQIAIRIGVTIE